MKNISNKLRLSILIFLLPLMTFSQNITLPPSGANQKCQVVQYMGLVESGFIYNSPDVTGPNGQDRKGKIWGELVPWGMVNLGFGTAKASPWRAGANENTVFYVSHDIMVEGKKLPAGKYGFFIAPEKDGPWTLIFSKNHTSWGAYFYDPAEDVLRVTVVPVECEYNEWLTFGFEDRQLGSCTAYLKWENLKVPIKLEVPDINELYLAEIRNELRDAEGFTYQSWIAAAQFCVRNNINLDEALVWAESAINMPYIGVENFNTLQTKAQVLSAMGRSNEADEVMIKAINHKTATVQNIHFYGRSLLAEGKSDKAMEIFQKNKKLHPEDKFTPNVGLARCYAATGDTKKAIKYWELAISNIPENQKPFMPQYEAELNKLKGK
jgi:tetratricopeptide (TPR) repeat protein